MDKGEFIKGGYTIQPGDGESWIAFKANRDPGTIGYSRGFTDWRDLVNWLEAEHDALARPPTTVDPTYIDLPEGTTLKEAVVARITPEVSK